MIRQAVVLCGGLGTRLRSVVADVPKVLAPIEGVPFLQHLLRTLAAQGVDDVLLSTGYLGEQIAAFAETLAPDGVRVRCVQEPKPLGTGGALRFVRDAARLSTPFFALNGDTFFTGRLPELATAHPADAAATLALVHVPTADRYGAVEADGSRIVHFREKEAGLGAAWINAGVYVLAPDALDAVPAGEKVSLERDVFPRWRDDGRLHAHRFPDATFLDIGTPEDYARAAALVRSDEPRA